MLPNTVSTTITINQLNLLRSITPNWECRNPIHAPKLPKAVISSDSDNLDCPSRPTQRFHSDSCFLFSREQDCARFAVLTACARCPLHGVCGGWCRWWVSHTWIWYDGVAKCGTGNTLRRHCVPGSEHAGYVVQAFQRDIKLPLTELGYPSYLDTGVSPRRISRRHSRTGDLVC